MVINVNAVTPLANVQMVLKYAVDRNTVRVYVATVFARRIGREKAVLTGAQEEKTIVLMI